MIINAKFNVIIPVTYSIDNVNRGGDTWNQVFEKRNTPAGAQIRMDVWKNENTTPLAGYYELSNKCRKQIGIHGNENYTYQLENTEIFFQLGKVHLLLYKTGVGFLSFSINAGEKEDNDILDLVADLCTGYLKRRITYKQAVKKGDFRTQTFTIKSLVENIIKSLLHNEYLFYPYEQAYFQRPKCLFYGYGKPESDKNLYEFLELLRCQRNSGFGRTVIEHKYLYQPWEYLSWACGENAIAGFANVDENKCPRRKTTEFLTGSNGLVQSVFGNYLLLYLNCLSVDIKWKMIMTQNQINNLHAVSQAPQEALEELSRLANTPLNEIAIYPHINTLFDEYVCQNALKLQDKMDYFNSVVDKVSEKNIHEDINKGISQIIQNTQETNERLGRIEYQMDNVFQFVRKDMQEWLTETRRAFRLFSDGSDDDEQIGRFVDESSRYINGNLLRKQGEFAAQKREELQSSFGVLWDKLLPNSQTSLISAYILWESCKRFADDNFDFSGVSISATSALEGELRRVFYDGFQKYLADTYGKPNKDNWQETYNAWPERFLSYPQRVYKRLVEQGRSPLLKQESHFAMGVMPFLFGRTDSRESSGQDELIKTRMGEYLGTILKEDYVANPIESLFRNNDDNCFVERCEEIRRQYRNPAAHVDIVTGEQAEQCCQFIIGLQQNNGTYTDVPGLIQMMYSFFNVELLGNA